MVNERLTHLQQVMNQIDDRLKNVISREEHMALVKEQRKKGRGKPFAILCAQTVPAELGFSTTSSASTILDHCFYVFKNLFVFGTIWICIIYLANTFMFFFFFQILLCFC